MKLVSGTIDAVFSLDLGFSACRRSCAAGLISGSFGSVMLTLIVCAKPFLLIQQMDVCHISGVYRLNQGCPGLKPSQYPERK
jgi:hypothetical protein